MKVAYYSPLPPSPSGVADYSALLLPALRQRVGLVLARPGRWRRPPRADLALYHVGNDPQAHGWIVAALARRPGVVVLHELVVHHLVAGITLARGDAAAYLAAMERCHGLVGRLLAHAVLDNRIPPLWETRPQDFPLTGEVLRHATGVIVHSRYAEQGVRAAGFAGPVWRIPHPAWPPPSVVPARVEGDPVIGCFGHLNEAKRLPQLYAAFRRLRARRPRARLLVVGQAAPRVAALEPPPGALREGYVEEERLWSLMAACDLVVSLRAPTMGETSGTVIRALSLGKPVVVSDVGWFSELPDEAALKVPVDEQEVERLAEALAGLVEDAKRRGTMAEAARCLAAGEHAVERVAELYAAALEEAAGGEAVRQAVLEELAAAAADAGIGPRDRELGELAERLREVGLGG
jgi:glycosyltransferase involved in cell wall biosynthesis